MHSNQIKYIFFGALAAGLIFLYKNFDPAAHVSFPRCPFEQFMGYQCPGCGSQRAVHQLLNLTVSEAFILNPLLVISVPYLLLGYIFENTTLTEKLLKVRKVLYGPSAMRFVLVIILLFWIGRNLPAMT